MGGLGLICYLRGLHKYWRSAHECYSIAHIDINSVMIISGWRTMGLLQSLLV